MLFGLARLIHFLPIAQPPFSIVHVFLPLFLLTSQLFNSNNANFVQHHKQRRTITTFVRDIGDGTKQNVILVQSNDKTKGQIIEELRKHLNYTEPGHRQQTWSSESSSAELDNSEEKDANENNTSEERDPNNSTSSFELSPINLTAADESELEQQRPDDVVSIIDSAFKNRKSFSCPKIKSDFVTGTSTANLSPEDIGIIAAMGDSLATGTGLWTRRDIEFRGAAFPIGGDATIDGLVTVPNILREFTPSNELFGVSHGMGHRDELPERQLNMAMRGALSSSLPDQARELIRRMKRIKEIDTWNTWALVIITVGTEEICQNCTGPDTAALIQTLDLLNHGLHKALVILVGPIHVSSSYEQQSNLLKTRCQCSMDKSNEFMQEISEQWARAFEKIQQHMENTKRATFNAVAIPMLTIHSRYPYSVFIQNKPLLSRRGHTYAAKWLWNRLIGGPKYNLSSAVLSQDAYFCPSLGCPYFRTPDNINSCRILTHAEEKFRKEQEEQRGKEAGGTWFGSRAAYLYFVTGVIVGIALVSVLVLGTIFYKRGKGNRRRFENARSHGPMPVKYRKGTARLDGSSKPTDKLAANGDQKVLDPSASSAGNSDSQITSEENSADG